MNTAQRVHRGKSRRNVPAEKVGASKATFAPHIFVPEPSETSRDRSVLFDLKSRPGYYNAAAKAALLRRAKKPPHDELLVDFSGSDVHVELKAANISLVSGDWTWQGAVAGESLNAQGPWSEVCWHREDAADYLEIELPLSHGWRLERQMVLAREDRFLLLTDSLIGPQGEAAEIRYSHSLPIVPEARFCATRETREGWLEAAGRRRATVVPPALAEWRSEFCHAELSLTANCLSLQQAALGRNLYAPLWIDLDPRRSKRPLTWRRLTVGENLAIVPRDIAAAYRIQAGREQWLIYRSLAAAGNRSVLGHNTAYSFVCLRILPDGEFKEIVEIE